MDTLFKLLSFRLFRLTNCSVSDHNATSPVAAGWPPAATHEGAEEHEGRCETELVLPCEGNSRGGAAGVAAGAVGCGGAR